VGNRNRLKTAYRELFGAQFGLEVRSLTVDFKLLLRADDWLLVSGRHAAQLARTEQGTHLFFDEYETMAPIQVRVFPLEAGVRPRAAIAEQLKERKRWIERLTTDEASVDDDPHPLDPVIRIYSEIDGQVKTTVDLRSGLTVARFPTTDDFRAFLASSLELPVELQG
jgi:hypothetical protein